jgi:nicotinamide-nucleotide amidase
MAALLEEAVVPYLQRRFALQGIIVTRVLRTSGVGESALDEKIGDLERLANPTVGLSAHPGRVDIRLTAKAGDRAAAAELLLPVERTIRERLGEAIYGADEETLEQVTAQALRRRGWRLTTAEYGTGGALSASLAETGEIRAGSEVHPEAVPAEELRATVDRARKETHADVGLGVSLKRSPPRHKLAIRVITPEGEAESQPSYGGAPENAVRWAVSLALDLLRRRLAEV